MVPAAPSSSLGLLRSSTFEAGGVSCDVEVFDLRPPAEAASERWLRPERPGSKELHVLRGLLTSEEVDDVLKASRGAAFEAEAEGSKNPVQTPVVVLKANGAWLGTESALQRTVEAAVEQRVLPYMREVYGDETLAAAEVLLRRYVPKERAQHALHFDHHAAATCVVDLAPLPGSGLFLQPGPSATSRAFAPLQKPGDAAVHAWDAFHGVVLLPDHERVSLIVWAKPQGDALSGETSWYRSLQGDVDAAYRLGIEAEGHRDAITAGKFFSEAAEAGHWMAMSRLGELLGSADDAAGAQSWARRAAGLGWAEAQVQLGDAQARQGQSAGAAELYRAAADQGHPAGLHRLGLSLLQGRGVAPDPAAAHEALQASAELGWADAYFHLAHHFAPGPQEQAEWLGRAAARGHPGAANSLAISAAKEGRHREARDLLLLAAEKGHPKAMANLAIYLREGVGGPADPQGAAEWAERAQQAAAMGR